MHRRDSEADVLEVPLLLWLLLIRYKHLHFNLFVTLSGVEGSLKLPRVYGLNSLGDILIIPTDNKVLGL